MSRVAVDIEREYGPFPEQDAVHGVTFDGERIWFATGKNLKAVDPESGAITRALDIQSEAGVAFDGKHLFQLAGGVIRRVDPQTGRVISSIPAPHPTGNSGLAWAEGSLWLGRGGDREILELDPKTGKVLRAIASDRFVTGVSFSDGELWHATLLDHDPEHDRSQLRRVDRDTGEVLECLELPAGVGVSGLEADGSGRFYCGGGKTGRVRVVKRPSGTRAPSGSKKAG
jgi:outer membrane protein assembly factor BamB